MTPPPPSAIKTTVIAPPKTPPPKPVTATVGSGSRSTNKSSEVAHFKSLCNFQSAAFCSVASLPTLTVAPSNKPGTPTPMEMSSATMKASSNSNIIYCY